LLKHSVEKPKPWLLLVDTVATMTQDYIIETITLYIIVAFDASCICYPLVGLLTRRVENI
jgi:hypothetical protein